MSTDVDGYAPTYDAKFLLNGISLMENLSLPFDLKQSLSLRYQKDKAVSDEIMQQCYRRSIQKIRPIGLWLLPVILLSVLLS